MRLIIIFIVSLSFIFSKAQSQTVKVQLCSHAWQQRPTASAIWNFKESGDFTAIMFWINKNKSGFITKKGKFNLDDSTKTIKMNFDSTYIVYSKDSFSVSKDIDTQEWHLITITDNKIVLSRPPVWEFEKRSTNDSNKYLIVMLDGGKKRRRDIKHKT